MQPQRPENPAIPPESGPEEPSARAEGVNLESLGVGRDMSAGSPEGWGETQPVTAPGPAGPETAEAGALAAVAEGERFEVKLQVFEGPLELLLHLVREHRLDIHDIPVAFITDQYIKYLDILRQLNINLASEYLVMASWLVYLKSRTLLPQTDEADDTEEDPESLRQELQRQLIEYQKFKGLSQVFRHAEEEQSWLYGRGGNGDGILLAPEEKEEAEEAPRLQATVFDLISALQHLIDSLGEEGVHLVEVDELEIADRQGMILERLDGAGTEGILFHRLLEGARVLELVATFLALLELIRRNLVVTLQAANFAEIRIVKAVNDD